jgi:hypothetical protein
MDDFTINLVMCQRLGCEQVATWETWTTFTYHYFCDEHRRPDFEITGGWVQRHRPEGVMYSGGDYVFRER